MPNDIQTTAQEFARVLLELFEQPQLIRGCLVKSVADKDEYTTNNGWIQAICGEHNQQPVRYFGRPAGLVVDTTYIDVLYFPSTKGFMVYGPGGTSDVGGAKVAQVWESDFGAVALQSDASGNIGIGTASPDGALHVLAGSAGTVSAVGGADTAVFEDDDAAGVGITILSPDAINNQIVFGVESDSAMCRILTNYNAGAPYLTVYVDGSERLRVNANGEVGIGITGPDGTLHVHTGSAGSVSPVAGADDFIVESDDSSGVGMTILAPDARSAQVVFGVPSSNAMARVLSNYNSGSPYLALFTSGSERVRVTAGGVLFVGDSANAKMTLGLTINQGANDDEIVALKSSDVAHGITDEAETDTFGVLAKSDGDAGGLAIDGYRDSDGVASRALILRGALGEAASTLKTTAAQGIINLSSRIKSGTGTTDVGSDGNLVTIRNNTTTRWIIDAEGDIFYGGSDDGTITDDYDDPALLSGFRALLSPQGSPAAQRFKGWLGETEDILVQQGVLTAPLASGGLVSDTALKGLLIDAIIQLNGKLQRLEDQLHGALK